MTTHDAGGVVLNDVAVADRTVLRRLVLLGTPLALSILEIFHPQPVGVGEAVAQGGWFMWFHIIQVPLIGLIALAVYLLTQGLQSRAASVSRWAIAVFAVFFSAYDAAAGIATGYALRSAQGLPAGAQETVHHAVIDMPGLSLIFGLSIVGTGAWVVALVAAAMALRGAGASRGAFALLILAGVFLMGGIRSRPARWPSGVSSWLLRGSSSDSVCRERRKEASGRNSFLQATGPAGMSQTREMKEV